jgi:hypothetical protein
MGTREPEREATMIKHVGKKWILYSSDGSRKLGEHDSKADAERQERAINISKARKAGHRIPRRGGK